LPADLAAAPIAWLNCAEPPPADGIIHRHESGAIHSGYESAYRQMWTSAWQRQLAFVDHLLTLASDEQCARSRDRPTREDLARRHAQIQSRPALNVFCLDALGGFCLNLEWTGVASNVIPLQLKKYGASNSTIGC